MATANYERRPKRLLSYSAIMLVILLLAYAALFSRQSWEEAEHEEASQLAMLADVGGTVLDSYLSQLEAALQNLSKDLNGARKPLDLDRAFDWVSRFQTRNSELESVTLIRAADGQLLMTGNAPYSPTLPTLEHNVSFKKLRDELQKDPSFAIGQPISGDIDNSWVVPARYGITDRAGKLTYIVSANLPINLIQRYLVESPKPGATTLGLFRDDGYLVSLYPEPAPAKLDQMFGTPVAAAMSDYLRANNFPRSGQVEGAGSVAPERVMQVMRRLKHYPLTLFIETPASEIKAVWWGKVRVPYFLMGLMLVGILAVYGWSVRRHKTWTQEQRREAIRRDYEQSLRERSPNEIVMFDADTLLFTYANDYALNNLGYSLAELQKRTFLSLHPELNIESFAALIEPLRRGERESSTYQTIQARADGTTYPVEIYLQLLTSDLIHECVAIINDITALRRAEENIRNFNYPVDRRSRRKTGPAVSA